MRAPLILTLTLLTAARALAADLLFTPEGIPTREDYFPIGVWLQSPKNAAKYKEAGINFYVGLWEGPNAEKLAELEKAGMPLVCEQNEYAKTQLGNPLIAAWMHGDEPDNAQPLPNGKGYGPPIHPDDILEGYNLYRKADPSRPVLLNLGQGVAWDGWIGRGERTNHPQDYPLYVRGCDIASFDIYPAVHDNPAIAGRLEYVGHGANKLAGWAEPKPTWTCIEAARINNPEVKPTPAQIRSEVWMAIANGSRGLIYFVHQFAPEFKEAALLDDPDLLPAVTAINKEIASLAAVLNSPPVPRVAAETGTGEFAVLRKRHGGYYYLFTVNMRRVAKTTTFFIPELPGQGRTIEEIGTENTMPFSGSAFAVEFDPYQARLFRIKEVPDPAPIQAPAVPAPAPAPAE